MIFGVVWQIGKFCEKCPFFAQLGLLYLRGPLFYEGLVQDGLNRVKMAMDQLRLRNWVRFVIF